MKPAAISGVMPSVEWMRQKLWPRWTPKTEWNGRPSFLMSGRGAEVDQQCSPRSLRERRWLTKCEANGSGGKYKYSVGDKTKL